MALAIGLMFADHRLSAMREVRSMLSWAVLPVQILVDTPISSVKWLRSYFVWHTELVQANETLHRDHLKLQVQLQKLLSLEEENASLRALLRSAQTLGERALVADILSIDLEPYTQQIMLDKGRVHGVFEGQPVLDAQGVMGQVVEVNAYHSRVLLLSDPSHAVPVQVNRNGLRMVAVGTGSSGELKLLYVPNTADVIKGDLLVTSGLGGRFPRGYPVGVVTDMTKEHAQTFAKATAKPTALLDRSRELLLIWPGASRRMPLELDPILMEREAD